MMEQLFGGQCPGGGEEPAPRAPRAAPGSGFLGIRAAQQQGTAPGVLVDMVVENGLAAAGGIQKGDCIVEVDGKAVAILEGLRGAMAGKGPGTCVKVIF